ncbi:RluA family pseudouridine synthase [Botrimarina hoheduenensis]|uniref:Pseudouridine synthase n=1 Tax=Botrimarina hoheduenensis TaxID=2528000 RepID=A0A5C5WD78_9BACT|nr:RluA family pseudouridine synthase [Botrimarina hoheduenensis]TWT48624.1 Pseudouridine synthase [Botrimarina hoheduenensis]
MSDPQPADHANLIDGAASPSDDDSDELLAPVAATDASTDWPREFIADETAIDQRLDTFLTQRLNEFSRVAIKRSIDAGHVLVAGVRQKPAYRLAAGEAVRVERLEPGAAGPAPEPIAIDLLYEDDDLAVVNKPPGMVVHPAKGHWSGTLASALAYHFGEGLSQRGGPTRPGIVHRLDRDTTGVIVVAKHDRAHDRLAAQFAERTVTKKYLALVAGVPDRDADVIEEPIGPHPSLREKMAVRRDHPDARAATTTYEVLERFRGFALVRATPKTGRTHQIRVHLAFAGYPVLCDRHYGSRSRITPGELHGRTDVGEETPILTRQALHAHRLSLAHPTTGEPMAFEAPLPADFEAVLRSLRG